MGVLEAVGLSFLSFFILKAGDIYSIDLVQLFSAGIGLAIVVYLPFLYLYSILSYMAGRVSRTGASLKGFIAGMIYALHPIGLGAIIILPSEAAVFGSYVFSNNPSPQTINPAPFYLFGFLECLMGTAAIFLVFRLTRLFFGNGKKTAIFAGIFFILLFTAMEITKQTLTKR